MHLESAETDLNLPHAPGKPPTAVRGDVPPPSREGLPAAFKMRREKHYVEQLMGDAPLRTVREIPVADLEPPEGGAADVDQLQQSIQALGILQPLLVSQPAARSAGDAPGRFTIIAGANRYRVAVQLGLRTVPCLVCETATHSVEALREAATRRASAPAPVEPAMPPIPDDVPELLPAAGLREVTGRLAFVSAVMPALDVAGYDPLRWNILTDLMKVEMEHARSTAAAVEWLSSTPATAARDPLDAAEALEGALDAVAPEARLKGVKVELSSSLQAYRLPADRAMLMRAITGLVQGMLALSTEGSTLRIECSGTAVRPALIVAVTQDDCAVSDVEAERFFDPVFAGHPAGLSGALVLGGVAQAARLHGGRAHARTHGDRGCTATFVVPKSLRD